MKRWTKQAAVGLGTGAAVAGGLVLGSYGISRLLLRMAVDRRLPRVVEKNRHRISGSGKKDFWLQASRAADRLRSLKLPRVEITARDGTLLVGRWFEHPQPRRVVVAMHGWRSSWDQDFGLIAPFLTENGCSILFAQQRGQQESGGSHMTFGIRESEDCAQWARWVADHGLPGLPIYLAGISMGATTVLMAAARELPDRVRGIVADCGFTSPHEIWRHVAEKNLHLHYALYQPWVDRLCRRQLQLQPAAASTEEALRRCKLPVLLIHGTEDRFVPVEMTYRNYRACAAPRELLIVPGAGHGMSYTTEPRRYQQTLLRFWEQWDAPSGS